MSLETRDTCAQSLVTPTKPGDVFSTAVLSNGNPYGVAEGLVYSFPCRSKVLPHSASDRTLSRAATGLPMRLVCRLYRVPVPLIGGADL